MAVFVHIVLSGGGGGGGGKECVLEVSRVQ